MGCEVTKHLLVRLKKGGEKSVLCRNCVGFCQLLAADPRPVFKPYTSFKQITTLTFHVFFLLCLIVFMNQSQILMFADRKLLQTHFNNELFCCCFFFVHTFLVLVHPV